MHEYRAEALADALDPASFVGDLRRVDGGKLLRVTEDMALALVEGIERIEDLCGSSPKFGRASTVIIEEKLYFADRELMDVYGTLDFGAVIPDEDEVLSSDLKFGKGVPVSPFHNPQQMIYLLLLLDNLSRADYRRVRRARIIIDQPRIERAGGEWVTTVERLERWKDKTLYPAVAATQARKPVYKPGPDQCFWCKARKRCEARAEFVGEALSLAFEDERDVKSLKDASALSAARRAYLLDHRDMIVTFLSDVHASVMDDAQKGRPTPGRKLVESASGHRGWINPAEAKAALTKLLGEEKAAPRSIISPAQAEKMLPRAKHEELKALIKYPPKVPKLVPLDDEREALESTIKFEDER